MRRSVLLAAAAALVCTEVMEWPTIIFIDLVRIALRGNSEIASPIAAMVELNTFDATHLLVHSSQIFGYTSQNCVECGCSVAVAADRPIFVHDVVDGVNI